MADRVECREEKRRKIFTQHTGSPIEPKMDPQLRTRDKGGKLRDATRGPVLGGRRKPLDSVPKPKERIHEHRNPDGNQYAQPIIRDILKAGRGSKATQRPPGSLPNSLNSRLTSGSTDQQRRPIAALRKQLQQYLLSASGHPCSVTGENDIVTGTLTPSANTRRRPIEYLGWVSSALNLPVY